MKTCSKCKLNQEDDCFSPKQSWCKECKRQSEMSRRISKGVQTKFVPFTSNTHKECYTCRIVKSHEDFYPSLRGRYKLTSDCHICISRRRNSDIKRRLGRLYTKRYRENNRETHLASHRITQFNRKRKIKCKSDGTVTKEFLKNIYAREDCYYCGEKVERKDRTLEHKIPLSKDGLHSISNIEMACIHCNSSKRDLSEEQFKNKLNGNISQNNNR